MDKAGLPLLEGLAWNPRTDAENLTRLARHHDNAVKLRALCNPATPEKVRRSELADPKVAHRVTDRRSLPGAQVVRAGVLVRTNSWLAEGDRWREQAPAIRRAITTLPDAPAAMLASSQARDWPSAQYHPARHATGARNRSVDELVEDVSVAAHFAALDREDFTVEHARRIKSHWLERPRAHPEPHLIAEVVGRYGAALFVPDEPVVQAPARASDEGLGWGGKEHFGPYAGTRIATTSWAAPEAWHILNLFAAWDADNARAAARALQDGRTAAETLGGDRGAWEVFLKLDAALGSGDGPGALELASLVGVV
jgi:hypothetical protein